MANHPDTWARIVEMVHTRFPDIEPTAQAFARFMYDTGETVAYAAATLDTDNEEQAILDVARGAAQLRGELCAELRDKATAAEGRSARVVARATHAEVLHANGPLGWATSAEVLNEVNDDESADFADEDAPDPTDE
jgi:hypothetical protein